MTEPTGPSPSEQAPEPAAVWVEGHAPPENEAQRQALETVRSVSRLEEAN